MSKYKYICTECGNESLYWDASAYWDVETQAFKMSDAGPNDTAFCGDCGAEHCSKTVDAPEPSEAEKLNTAYRQAATNTYYKEGEIEIDENAVVSMGDDPGAYVAAWVWVYKNALRL